MGNRYGKANDELFESTVLPYLSSAYNLARWLTRNEHDAEDIVQEAFLRALRSFDTFTAGRDARAWLLTIVRNCCRTWHRKNRSHEMADGMGYRFAARGGDVVGSRGNAHQECEF